MNNLKLLERFESDKNNFYLKTERKVGKMIRNVKLRGIEMR
jgi:hypothetical protein